MPRMLFFRYRRHDMPPRMPLHFFLFFTPPREDGDAAAITPPRRYRYQRPPRRFDAARYASNIYCLLLIWRQSTWHGIRFTRCARAFTRARGAADADIFIIADYALRLSMLCCATMSPIFAVSRYVSYHNMMMPLPPRVCHDFAACASRCCQHAATLH